MVVVSTRAAKDSGSEFRWNGPAARGAMALRRAQKRAEAEARNADAQPVILRAKCGHRHGAGRRCAA